MSLTTTDRLPLRRWLAIGAAATTLILVLAACSGASASPSPEASVAASPSSAESVAASVAESTAPSEAAGGGYVLTIADTTAGSSLAGEGGMTLYTKSDDTAATSTCIGGCATAWPPFTVDAGEEVTAGDGVTGTIGQITRDDGSLQVTYNGHPLYYYGGDANPGDSTGEGLGGIWHIADPAIAGM